MHLIHRATFLLAIVATTLFVLPTLTCQGAITFNGDVASGLPPVPADPNQWTYATITHVGATSYGSVTVDGGSYLDSGLAYIGYDVGSIGSMTVVGAASAFCVSGGSLSVGEYGSGSLSISGGGIVANGYAYIAKQAGSTGAVTVTGSDSIWNSDQLFVGGEGHGTLTVADGASVNSTWGCIGGRVGDPKTGTGTVTVHGNESVWNSRNGLCVGYFGSAGTLTISGGAMVIADSTSIGNGATAVLSVDGVGSKCVNAGHLYVGSSDNGMLTITGGGCVTNSHSYIGFGSNSKGVVTVAEPGSTWTNNGDLRIGGYNLGGTLNISGGAAVTATSLTLSGPGPSVLAIDVDGGTKLSIGGGAGTISGGSGIRIMAGAKPADGAVFSPIAGVGTGYQAIGGRWNTNKTFTVSDVEAGVSGAAVAIDLVQKQRIKVDAENGWSIGASFRAASSSKPLSVTATAMGHDTLAILQSLLDENQKIAAGWSFSVSSGFAAGNPAYLSFDIGSGYSRDDLALWRFDQSGWKPYSATDLNYDGTYANFTVTNLSGYAVAVVPEPGNVVLLTAAGAGLLIWRNQRRFGCAR